MPNLFRESDPASWLTQEGCLTVGANLVGQLVQKSHDGTITPIVSGAPANLDYQNTAGTTTILQSAPSQLSTVTVQGAARVVPIAISRTGALGQMTVLVLLPAVAGLVIKLYDDVVNPANLLDTYTSDGAILNGTWFLYYAVGKWNLQMSKVPSF